MAARFKEQGRPKCQKIQKKIIYLLNVVSFLLYSLLYLPERMFLTPTADSVTVYITFQRVSVERPQGQLRSKHFVTWWVLLIHPFFSSVIPTVLEIHSTN